MKKIIIAVAFIFLAAPIVSAETIHLKDGRKLKGEVVNVDVKKLTLKYKSGTISSVLTFTWSEIDKVTRKDKDGNTVEINYRGKNKIVKPPKEGPDTPPDKVPDDKDPVKVPKTPDLKPEKPSPESDREYADRIAKTHKKIAKTYVDLARWCAKNGRVAQARDNYRRALKFDSKCREAAEGLGLVYFKGRWMKRSERRNFVNKEIEEKKLAREMQDNGYDSLAGVWVKRKFKAIVDAAPNNRKFSYILLLQRFRDARRMSKTAFDRLDNETKEIWEYLAPREQKRICPEMVGMSFTRPFRPKISFPKK